MLQAYENEIIIALFTIYLCTSSATFCFYMKGELTSEADIVRSSMHHDREPPPLGDQPYELPRTIQEPTWIAMREGSGLVQGSTLSPLPQ